MESGGRGGKDVRLLVVVVVVVSEGREVDLRVDVDVDAGGWVLVLVLSLGGWSVDIFVVCLFRSFTLENLKRVFCYNNWNLVIDAHARCM